MNAMGHERILVVSLLSLLAIAIAGCDFGGADQAPDWLEGSSEAELEGRILSELQERSFRRFEPSRDASPRKGVILEFFDGPKVWGQYAVDDRAVNEWEVVAEDYHIGWNDNVSEVTITFHELWLMEGLPNKCDDCIHVSSFSLSIRDLFNREKISFKVNAPSDVLPPPFPIFTSWTRFEEDVYFE